jgi:hypothetical protein
MYDAEKIYEALLSFFDELRNGTHALPDALKTSKFARRNQAHQLGGLLDQLLRK